MADAETDADKKVNVMSKYSNLAGLYHPMGDFKYARKDQQTFLYRVDGQGWCFAKETESNRFFAKSEEEKDFPWQCSAGSYGEDIQLVEKLLPADLSKVPKKIYVQSKFGNVDGGFELLDEPFDCFAAYENKEDGVVLWHELNNGTWNVTPAPVGNSQSYTSCAGNEHDPTKVDLKGFTKGIVTAIEAIDFKPASKDDGKYIDNKFPPTMAAIGETRVGKKDVEWVRSTDLNRDDPDALFYMIEPTDLLQGSVGDCWLIASIAALAEFPDMVKRLFVGGEEVSSEGRYDIQLYDMRKSDWVTLTIDDLIPCAKRGWWDKKAEPLFAKVCGNELWAILLEKAFARFVGSYEALSGGHTVWAWQCLTGVENQISILKNGETGAFDQYSIDTKKQKKEMEAGDRRACPLTRYDSDPRYDEETLFEYLLECDEKKYMMSSGIRSAPGEIEHERDDGLVEGHAYSLLAVAKVGDVKLIQLRNPWGNDKEWNGSWSDNSLTWDEYPDVEAELNPSHKADGTFWMDYNDFARIYSSINVCPTENSPLQGAERLPTIMPMSDIVEGVFKPMRTNFRLDQGNPIIKMLLGACMAPSTK
eukprot:GEMP01007176.1.p1 GENE.GEMP01007176.1~~GEMP01007176.1.p1  ORF type:complete len:589 (+),score=128.06 GEMP01007176.1:88-1854(+)